MQQITFNGIIKSLLYVKKVTRVIAKTILALWIHMNILNISKK